MDRAFATLALKSLDDDQRTFSGTATSPEPDRIGDIIEPLGALYRNPTVLLHQHQHDKPIGEVRFDRPSKSGVGFTAKIPKISEPGPLRDRVDTAWGEIKHGLVRAVSIGFRSLASEPLASGGLRFKKIEILELSTVSVPAQALATITEVRAIDAAIRRGETPSTVQASSLWLEAVAAGKIGMDRTKGTDLYQRASGALRTSMLAGDMSRAMIEVLCARIEKLERQQSEPAVRYVGIWRSDRAYRKGDFATHSGSLWHCNGPTDLRPGEGGGWQLAVKAGRDGKDLRQ